MRIFIAFFLVYFFSFSFLKAGQKEKCYVLKNSSASYSGLLKKANYFTNKNDDSLRKGLFADLSDGLQHHHTPSRSLISVLFKSLPGLNTFSVQRDIFWKCIPFNYDFILNLLYPKHTFW